MDNLGIAFFGFAVLFISTLALTLFTYTLPKQEDVARSKTLGYFRLFLTFMLIGYAALVGRIVIDLKYSVVATNLFFQLATYMLLLSLLHKYYKVLTKRLISLIVIHTILLAVFHWITFGMKEILMLRNAVSAFSISLPLVLCGYTIHSLVDRNNLGEKILISSLVISVLTVVSLLFFTAIFFDAEFSILTFTMVLIILSLEIFVFAGLALSFIHSLVAQLRIEAITDKLTGTYNRHYFYNIAEKMHSLSERQQSTYSLLITDIDNFKAINDSHGHDVGDKVLIEFSDCLKKTIRNEDSLIRMGGEEFIVLLPGINNLAALQAAERFREAVNSIVIKLDDGSCLSITASFGITEIDTSLNIDENVKLADQALYKAKNSGKDCIICHQLTGSDGQAIVAG